MKTDILLAMWGALDNANQATKPYSFRLPISIGAKIDALCEMYPQRNRTQLVADILNAALDDLERTLPHTLGEEFDPEALGVEDFVSPDEPKRYHIQGPRKEFRRLADKHYEKLEAELKLPISSFLYGDLVMTKDSYGKK
ncbi:hypothetical protein [Polynucleobacter sp. UB-Tiil-W10]|uniref:hypothetical protein n=1 Tax=Polynucleobacter sp. UB-Tiil-W10 TaxID=1855648 RepID=UPI001C0E793A|nr:hypothetical protein [Polynucleobacter sp. UB-Tiil-W10]MBU3541414.1 hypothetical protein [Polynucleobacter sp. UB-Tiil-W10]